MVYFISRCLVDERFNDNKIFALEFRAKILLSLNRSSTRHREMKYTIKRDFPIPGMPLNSVAQQSRDLTIIESVAIL